MTHTSWKSSILEAGVNRFSSPMIWRYIGGRKRMEGEVREGEGQKNKFRKKHSSVAYTFNMQRTNTRA